jgi:cell division GTPase FtsZ
MKPSQSSFKIPSSKNNSFADLKPRITVVGVGGAGGNAVNNMIRSKLEGVDFTVCNTDAQALGQSLAEQRIQLGLGRNSRPRCRLPPRSRPYCRRRSFGRRHRVHEGL